MARFIIALFLLMAAAQAANAACASTGNRAGCTTPNGAVAVGPNGAATYNKNTGAVHGAQRTTTPPTTTQPTTTQSTTTQQGSSQVAPGTSVQGQGGNTATKAVQPGCAFVNGKRVCK